MAKRVVLATFGSMGDLYPFIALALALKERGARPVIACAADYHREMVEAAGIEFHEVAPRFTQVMEDAGIDGGDMIRGIAKQSVRFLVDNFVTPYLGKSYADMCEVMRGADVAVISNLAVPARIAAAKLGVPVASVLLSPCLYFSAEEPGHFLEAPWLPGFRRLFGVRATRALMNIGRAQSRRALRALTDFRRQAGVAIPPGDEIIDVPLQAERVFGLYSPHLGALPADAPAQARIAGFSFYDGAAGGGTPLSFEAEEFFATGLPPVVFTLGSSGVHAPGRFYEEAVEAARSLRKRALLLVGEDTAPAAHLAARDVCVMGYAPHSLVFPRAAAVVHHGGIGTVAQAMRAGRPQLVCPMLGDQADNAERLIRLGVAGRLDHKSFTAERAARALGWLTSDAGVAARAGAIASSVAAEDGAGMVADEVLAMCAGGCNTNGTNS